MIGVVSEVLVVEQVWAGGRKGVEEEREQDTCYVGNWPWPYSYPTNHKSGLRLRDELVDHNTAKCDPFYNLSMDQ
jgi:hypothetical protein